MSANSDGGARLRAPFPYFGGKATVAATIWSRFGNVATYIEPFAGSCAVLLARPMPTGTEVVNDADGLLVNAWRSIAYDPEATARHADDWCCESDIHAWHAYLVAAKADLVPRLEGDPHFYDAELGGRWLWGMANWLGSGWCSGRGPWTVVNGRLVDRRLLAVEAGDTAQRLTHTTGVARQRPVLTAGNALMQASTGTIGQWFSDLRDRLRYVRIVCGDWSRVVTPVTLFDRSPAAVFLDPPYAGDLRDPGLYVHDSGGLSSAVRDWCLRHSADRRLRICLAGYEGEHELPDDWDVVSWEAHGGYANQGNRRHDQTRGRERLWFSRGCLRALQPRLL